MGHVKLSPKHGLNPSMMQCFFCGETYAIALPGLIRRKGVYDSDIEAPHKAVWSMDPCDNCKSLMAKGVILISIRNGEKPPPHGEVPNPYRTGGWCVVAEAFIKRVFGDQATTAALSKRWLFIDDAAWDLIGLPRDTGSRISAGPRLGNNKA